MKDKILLIGLFFVLMAALPLGMIANGAKQSANEARLSAPQQSENEEACLKNAAALCDDSFSDEAVKAMAIVARTNCLCGAEAADDSIDTSSKLYGRIEKYYRSENTLLLYNNKPVAVPAEKCSNGFTKPSPKQEYIAAVASPWDCFCKDFSPSVSCSGVSANGLDYLCKKGLSAEEALKWYLPNLTISE